MPFLLERITEIVFLLFILALMGNLFLISIVFLRRQRRRKFFRRADALREEYRPVVNSVLSGSTAFEVGVRKLREVPGADRMFMLERICLESKPTPAEEPVLGRLCEDLGLVKIWQQRVMGQIDQATLQEALINPQGLFRRVKALQFLIRSESAENLGLIRHEPSWPLLVKALEDSNPDLQGAAVRALAAIRHPGSLPALIKQLHRAVLDPAPTLSVRTLKSALVSFSLSDADELVTSLRHTNLRIRFLATDIIREMVEREARNDPGFHLDVPKMKANLAEAFLTELPFDTNPDVRARAAPVIAHFADPRADRILFNLLEDAVWFVRLHAVRSLAKPKFTLNASRVAIALTDPNWKVRQEAVRTLRGFGPVGLDLLTVHFLATRDRYSWEQIADEFQRAGLIPELLTRCAEAGNGRETAVLSHLAEMGKTSYMISVLESGDGSWKLRRKFLQELGRYPDPQIHEWVERETVLEPDFNVRALARQVLASSRSRGGI